jgi:hypothetical protein
MFRKLYWVSEQVFDDHSSQVNGVYTSIPDLVKYGLRFPTSGQLRLTLTKLDSDREPLGRWFSPGFDSLASDLDAYVKTDEFSADQVQSLLNALMTPASATVTAS